MTRVALTALLCLSLVRSAYAQTAAGSTHSAAGAPSLSVKDEARRRFDRGLTLYNAGDLNGALAEFRLAYRLTAHPVVLYNLALVHAGLGHSAEAVEALEKLQGDARHELGSERAERARKVYEEQLLRVGALEIKTDVARAQVQIDSIDVAKTPSPPLRVTAGTHVVSLSAPQHEPVHMKVTVAGRAVEVLNVKLTPLEQALAHLTPSSTVPDVEVRANGELVGRTPFASNLAFRPGSYDFEFNRNGYVPVRRRLELGPGSAGRIDAAMVPTDAGLAAGGTLAFRLSETDAVVSVDGQPRLDHTLGLRLPLGRHHVRIQRAGFFDVEREVWVRRGQQTIDVTLLPTAAHLDDYVSTAKKQRLFAYLALGSGAVVTAASAGFLLWNQGEKNEAEEAFDRRADEVARMPNGTCDSEQCERELTIMVEELDARRSRDVYGWVGVGVGALVLGTGAFLFATGSDPGRYDPKPESDVFGTLAFGLRGTGLKLGGAF